MTGINSSCVQVVKAGRLHFVQVCGFTLDITATDKQRCTKIADDLRQRLDLAYGRGKSAFAGPLKIVGEGG